MPRAELDLKVAAEALKSHPESSVKSILQQSFAAQMQGDEYVQQTLDQAQSQDQSQAQSQEFQTRDASPEQDLER